MRPTTHTKSILLGILFRRKKVFVDSLARARYDILELGGGGASSTVISPKMFDEFVAPYEPRHRFKGRAYVPPTRIRLRDADGTWHVPFVYPRESKLNLETFEREYVEDTSTRYPIKLFVRGDEYKMWSVFETDLHLFGIQDPEGTAYLCGSDRKGRDILSRVLYGTRISMSRS